MSHVWVGVLLAAVVLFTSTVASQSARDVRGPSPLIAIDNEAPPKLIVDPPLPEPLSRGLVFIQYGRRTCASSRCSAKALSKCRRASATSTSPSTTQAGTLSTPAVKR